VPRHAPASLALPLAAALCCPSSALAAESAWEVEPYWRPVAGVSAYSTGSGTWVGARMGALGGLHYWRSPLAGRTRAVGAWTTGSSGLSGLELRLGSFLGPSKQYWGAEAGLDLFWDRVTLNGSDLLPGSAGVDVPLNLHFGLPEIYGLAGVGTAFLFAPERRVDWSETDAFGFGHEFGWQLGAGTRLGGVGAALTYSHRVVVSGVHSGWSVSLSL
jgi:hypothetical protein